MNIDQVWNEYQTGIKAFLHAKVSNPADVDDLLQEILIKTHKNLGSIKTDTSIQSWVFQIARNATIDYYRKQGNAPALQAEDLWYTENEADMEHALSPCVAPFIKALPKESADLLTAIDIEGQSQKDYSERLGISYSTLKSRVQSGRKQLQGLFNDCCHLLLDGRGKVIDYQSKSGDCKC